MASADTDDPDRSASARAVLATLRRVADDLGHPPTSYEFNRHSDADVGHANVYRWWDSWTDALAAAGLDPDAMPDHRAQARISTDELLADLRAGYAALGTPPRSVDMDVYGAYNRRTYFRRFGSWPAALRAADIPVPESIQAAADGAQTRREETASDE